MLQWNERWALYMLRINPEWALIETRLVAGAICAQMLPFFFASVLEKKCIQARTSCLHFDRTVLCSQISILSIVER